MATELLPVKEQGSRDFKIGWGPFGRRDFKTDEAILRAARDVIGSDSLLMVDAGASDAYWPGTFEWAIRTAEMLADYNVSWFEEALPPDAPADYVALPRIAGNAREHGVRFIAHGWNTTVGLASDLQIASALPDTDLVEYLTGSPFIDDLRVGGWRLDGQGMLSIPDGPGLGIELDLHALAQFARVSI